MKPAVPRAVGFLLRGATGGDRGDIVQEMRWCARSRAGCRPSRAILWTMICPAADLCRRMASS
jgi:hypothetical protein